MSTAERRLRIEQIDRAPAHRFAPTPVDPNWCGDCRLTEADHDAEQRSAKAARDETPTLPWLQPATVDPDWLTEARNHTAATREPFTHPLWDVSAA